MKETNESTPEGTIPSDMNEDFAQRLAQIHENISEGKWQSVLHSHEMSDAVSDPSINRSHDVENSEDRPQSVDQNDREIAPESLADLLILIEEVRQIDPQLLAEDECSDDDHLGDVYETPPQGEETGRTSGDDTPYTSTTSDGLNTAPTAQPADNLTHPAEAVEFQLGRFKVQELIGQGGFGLVYAAYDSQLDRRIAIKIPKPEALLSRTLRKRFIREGRAAACLSHPHIVAVHEVGQQGPICYMATELIKGPNLSEWTQNQPFDPRLIAWIMIRTAEAIQHAHSRGILHRDLKPANILMEGENPKITDFGLAQRLEPNALAGELSLDTRILGTPAYMSPEQAIGNRDQIDARTDVYGLGAILYFMLTQQPPFSGSSPVEVIEAVRKLEPKPPASLNSLVPLDLQAICLKCLEKSPGDRYESAFGLQADLQKYLAGRPVSARRITNMEQAFRWCRRNPVLAGLMALAVSAVTFAVLASSIAWYSTRQALNREQAARVESDDAYRSAKAAIDKYFVTVSQNQLLTAPGLKTLRQELLQNAVAYYSGFIDKHQEDESLARDLMRAFTYRAIIDDELGNYSAAREGFETALQLLDGLQRDSESDPELQQQHGIILRKLARLDRQTGDTTAALAKIEQAVAIHRELLNANFEPAANHGELGTLLKNRANIHAQAGNPTLAMDLHRESENHFQSAAMLEPDNPNWLHQVSTSKGSQATIRLASGDSQTGEELLTETAQTLRQLIDEHPDQLGFQMDLGKALANLGMAQGYLGRMEDQLASFMEATHVFDRLATIHPQVVSYQALRSSTRRAAALVLNNLNRMQECAAQAEEAVAILQEAVNKAPGNVGIQQELVLTQSLLGRVWRSLGDSDKAREYLTLAIEALNRGYEQNPGDLYAGQNLAEAYQQLALVADDAAEAVGYLDRAQSVVEQLLEKWPGNSALIGIQGIIEETRPQVADPK
jgi:eukaryotic-like serine/threonine-protein kinase